MKKMLIGVIALSVLLGIGLSGSPESVSAESMRLDAVIRTSDIRIKSPMKKGEEYDVRVKVTNKGEEAWGGRDFFLNSRIYRGPSGSGTQRDELTPDVPVGRDTVDPDAYHYFEYEVQAPNYVGTYIIEWTMMHKSTKFGDKPRKTIKVIE